MFPECQKMHISDNNHRLYTICVLSICPRHYSLCLAASAQRECSMFQVTQPRKLQRSWLLVVPLIMVAAVKIKQEAPAWVRPAALLIHLPALGARCSLSDHQVML